MVYASQSTRASARCLLHTCTSCITSYLSLDLLSPQWFLCMLCRTLCSDYGNMGPFFWLHHQALSACYWIFRYRSDFLKTSFLTNGHLLLPGTIFGHTKLISCFWSAALLVIGECILVYSAWNYSVYIYSLHPVASPTLLASPRLCLLLMTNVGYMTIYTSYAWAFS